MFIIYIFFNAIFSAPLALLRHEFEIINAKEYLFLLRIAAFCEFSLILYFISLNFRKSIIKKIILFLWIIFTVYYLYEWYISDKNIFSPYPNVIGGLVTFVLLVFLLFGKTQTNAGILFYRAKIFWFIIAIMLISTGLLYILTFSKTAVNNEDFRNQYRIISSTLIITKNILISIGLLIKEKTIIESGK